MVRSYVYEGPCCDFLSNPLQIILLNPLFIQAALAECPNVYIKLSMLCYVRIYTHMNPCRCV